MASKLSLQQADDFFYQIEMKIREKRKIFNWNFLGQAPTESLRTQDSEYVYERGVENFLTVFCLPEAWSYK